MRAFTAVAALCVLLVSCNVFESRPGDSPAPSSARTASPPPAVILSKLAVTAKLGEQGIRVSPNGEMLLVVEREEFQHTIYDLAGRTLASVKLGEIGMNPFWLPDSSGVVIGRRLAREAGDPYLLDLSVLEPSGGIRDIARRVGYPGAEGQLVSPDGMSLALNTPCCPSSVIVVPRQGGAAREIATSTTPVRVLSWDADGHVVYWAGGDALDAAGIDGSRYRVPLGLPSGVKAVDISPGARTTDGVATVLTIQADGAFPGTGERHVADRTLVARELRSYQTNAPLYIRLTAHEALMYAIGGAIGAYDITTGTTRMIATIKDDDHVQPTTMSGTLLMSSPGRSWVRILDIERDDRWHEADVGRILQAAGYALSRGRFLVFDEGGAPYVLDGAAARAAPARAMPPTSLNAVAGTVRSARNAAVGRKMDLAWQMPDGAPQSLDYFGGSLVVVALWTRTCVPCTQQLGLLSDVTIGRPRVEIIALGVDETESSALDAAKDYKRLRPLVGTRAALKDIGVDVIPQTFILDSDHVVRQVIVGPLSWDALVRALTAASKSRLALRDGDVALS
ncbi:MAG: TlpA family protein disulfide reductase [Candidatus Limnocylindria bacterium]